MLDGTPVATLREALGRVDSYGAYDTGHSWPMYDAASAIARVRLELFSGAPAGEIERFRQRMPPSLDWAEVVWSVTLPSFDAELFERVTPEWRWMVAHMAVSQVNHAWSVAALPMVEWAIGKRGTIEAIEPLEQKRGPRGYGKPKPVSLAKVAGNDRLPPWDAKVARAIRKARYFVRQSVLDRAAAIVALIGHPAVVLAEAPEQFVDVVEGSPELEVVKEGDGYRMRVIRLTTAPRRAARRRRVPRSRRRAAGAARDLARAGRALPGPRRSCAGGARRDLAAERANLDAVLDALPFLDEPDVNGVCEWVIADAEEALGAVERLPTLAAVAAVEWPKGKPVRVVTVDAPELGLVVKVDRDWFRLGGRVAVDERTVIDFETVLAAAQSRSRFVPMGEGMYVALTHSLKTRLADLAAVAESDRDGMRVSRVAALWLDEALAGATLEADDAFRNAIERLRRAQDEAAAVPRALRAELRPYQEDGYRWAMRLAGAGLAAVSPTTWARAGQDAAGACRAARARQRGRGAGHRADLGVRQLARGGAPVRAHYLML